jgi:hypothetical protein
VRASLQKPVCLEGWLLACFIGLDYQKGPDLLLDALPILANLDCQVGAAM